MCIIFWQKIDCFELRQIHTKSKIYSKSTWQLVRHKSTSDWRPTTTLQRTEVSGIWVLIGNEMSCPALCWPDDEHGVSTARWQFARSSSSSSSDGGVSKSMSDDVITLTHAAVDLIANNRAGYGSSNGSSASSCVIHHPTMNAITMALSAHRSWLHSQFPALAAVRSFQSLFFFFHSVQRRLQIYAINFITYFGFPISRTQSLQCLSAHNIAPDYRDDWNASRVCLSHGRPMQNTPSITVMKQVRSSTAMGIIMHRYTGIIPVAYLGFDKGGAMASARSASL